MSGINAREDISNRKLITETIKLKIAEFIELVEDATVTQLNGNSTFTLPKKQNPVPQEILSVNPEQLITADEFNAAMTQLCSIFIKFRSYYIRYLTYRHGDGALIGNSSYSSEGNVINNYTGVIMDDATLTPIQVASETQLTDKKVTEVLDDLYEQWKKLPMINKTIVNWACHCNCNHSSGGWK